MRRFKAWILEKAVKILDEEELFGESDIFNSGASIERREILRMARTFRRGD